jgi:hypothetical protein
VGLELIQRCVVVNGRVEPSGADHIMSFELEEPVRVHIEAGRDCEVVLMICVAAPYIRVRKKYRVVHTGLEPAIDAIARECVKAIRLQQRNAGKGRIERVELRDPSSILGSELQVVRRVFDRRDGERRRQLSINGGGAGQDLRPVRSSGCKRAYRRTGDSRGRRRGPYVGTRKPHHRFVRTDTDDSLRDTFLAAAR